jgi:hypothetical protein
MSLDTTFHRGQYRVTISGDRFAAGTLVELRESARPDSDGDLYVYGDGGSGFIHYSHLEAVNVDEDDEVDDSGDCDCGDCSDDSGTEYEAGYYRITRTHRNSQGRQIEAGIVGRLRDDDTSDGDGEIQLEYTDSDGRSPVRWTNVNHIEWLGEDAPESEEATNVTTSTESRPLRTGDRVTLKTNTEEPGNATFSILSQGDVVEIIGECGSMVDVRNVATGVTNEGLYAWRFKLAAPNRLRVGDRVRIVSNSLDNSGVSTGDFGEIVRDDATAIPFQVRMEGDDRQWWFRATDLEPADATPTPVAPARPKVGDRVRSLIQVGGYIQIGDEGTITHDDESSVPFRVQFDNHEARWFEAGNVAAVNPAAAPTDAHAADIATISRMLSAEAVRRNWCGDYDSFIAAVNPHLTVKITPREQFFQIKVGDFGSYAVSAFTEAEANEKIRAHLRTLTAP